MSCDLSARLLAPRGRARVEDATRTRGIIYNESLRRAYVHSVVAATGIRRDETQINPLGIENSPRPMRFPYDPLPARVRC